MFLQVQGLRDKFYTGHLHVNIDSKCFGAQMSLLNSTNYAIFKKWFMLWRGRRAPS